jgi:hypothetical protein
MVDIRRDLAGTRGSVYSSVRPSWRVMLDSLADTEDPIEIDSRTHRIKCTHMYLMCRGTLWYSWAMYSNDMICLASFALGH